MLPASGSIRSRHCCRPHASTRPTVRFLRTINLVAMTGRAVTRHRSMTAMFPSTSEHAGGRREAVQPFDLRGAQLDAVGGCVLLDAGDPLGAGNRGDVVALRKQPGQRDLCRCRDTPEWSSPVNATVCVSHSVLGVVYKRIPTERGKSTFLSIFAKFAETHEYKSNVINNY